LPDISCQKQNKDRRLFGLPFHINDRDFSDALAQNFREIASQDRHRVTAPLVGFRADVSLSVHLRARFGSDRCPVGNF
jgi:hypothetical protein